MINSKVLVTLYQRSKAFSTTGTKNNAPRHWLDTFDGLNDKLESTMRKWWFKSLVESRCRPGCDLEGVDQMTLRASLEESYQSFMNKYGNSSDSRTKMHVSCACLILATHASLSLVLHGPHADSRIVEIIQEHHGSKSKPFLQYVMTSTGIEI